MRSAQCSSALSVDERADRRQHERAFCATSACPPRALTGGQQRSSTGAHGNEKLTLTSSFASVCSSAPYNDRPYKTEDGGSSPSVPTTNRLVSGRFLGASASRSIAKFV